MIDLHSHILPGVDDGPGTLEGSLAMARAAVEAGVSVMVGTPHVDLDHDVDVTDVAARVAELNVALAEAGIDLLVRSGGEIALPRLAQLDDETLHDLRLGGGPYLLVESPHTPVVGALESVIEDARRAGHQILLAHPERCPLFQRDPERLRRIVAAGVLVQITAGSMSGRFGDQVRRFTHRLLREELVHVVASDAHDTRRRPPGAHEHFTQAARDLPGVEELEGWLCTDVPRAVLSGDPLPPRPDISLEARGAWGRLRRTVGRR